MMRPDLGPASLVTCLYVLLATATTAVASAPAHQLDPDDARLLVLVRTELVNDPTLGTEPIRVDVRDGTVTLSGRVTTMALADRAVEVVRAVGGVREVTSAIVVGPAAVVDRERPGRLPALAGGPGRRPLRVLGVGVAGAYVITPDGAVGDGIGVGPLIRLRAGRGWGPTIGFSWSRTPLERSPDGDPPLADIVVRPVMVGAEYGIRRDRVSTAVSLVGGYSINSLQVDTSRPGTNRAISVANSLAVRAGVSSWFDLTPRLGLNLFGGYRITRPTVTFASDTVVTERRVNADAVVLSVGLAYWIF